MNIPRFDELYNFVLKAMHEAGGVVPTRQIDEFVASYLSLSPREVYRDFEGGKPKLYHELAQTRAYLREAGYINMPSTGHWSLAEKGVRAKEVSKEDVLRARKPEVGLTVRGWKYPTSIDWQAPKYGRGVSRVVFKMETATGLGSLPPLTTQYLESEILPYFRALNDFQEVISELRGGPRKPIVLLSLRMMSPLDVSFEGAGDVIDKVRDDIIPWRRKHAKNMANLEEMEKYADIRQKEAEILEIQAKTAESDARKDEILSRGQKAREEVEQLRIKNQREKLQLAREKFDLAIHIVKTIAPNSSPADTMRHVSEIMPALETLLKSDIIPTLPDGRSKG